MLSEAERKQVDAANGSGKPVVVFIHGLWLLAGSWDAWRGEFESAGYSTVAADWPDDPPTVADARQHPEVFAGKSIAQIADHLDELVRAMTRKPAIVGHSFGGLMTQILAGRGLSAVSVAIDPAPFRGVLPLPLSALRSAMPVLVNPLNRGRAVTLNEKQFRYGWGNALSDDESRKMHDTFHVAGAGKPDLSGRAGQHQSVDRGEGRHETSGARTPVDHRWRDGPHRPVVVGQRGLQAAEEELRPQLKSRRLPAAATL